MINSTLTTVEQLFENQLEALCKHGCPDEVIREFLSKKGIVISKIGNMSVASRHVLFVPVIPVHYRTFHDQIAMIKSDKKGFCFADTRPARDILKTPDRPYYLVDVNCDLHGVNARLARRIIRSADRSPLTSAEVIALCIHTNILASNTYLRAVGSKYGFRKIPAVAYNYGKPVFCWDYTYNADGNGITPHCRVRV